MTVTHCYVCNATPAAQFSYVKNVISGSPEFGYIDLCLQHAIDLLVILDRFTSTPDMNKAVKELA